MINSIEELLQNIELQQQVKEATNLAETTKLITTAGTEKGYYLTEQQVAQIASELMLEKLELRETDLLTVAGAFGYTNNRYCF
ncbi:Nif11-like leader peptide family natural product precursor [Nostoc sp. 106C]|jgi:CO/xanthine dehydrogenase Mo-binding subunit|uniref:Nif11-like leader peptide family natural product precursor n=1 Tax=Nostoc sp. 106C TaxID=1932667 RepID=UPI000A37B3BE|nr:Nif11-like leader peptide family natural product precursor [Nostoc sp. 106C]OUL21111.1 Nif11-like leader peptide family natural product precursor [Nostoc sp. RF31YmG]OUL35957.1 Nif11-like leader peptide family natural product precursor [Nostoc sp. 106C]